MYTFLTLDSDPKNSIFHSSSQVSSSPSSSHNKYDNPADSILLDSDNDRDANKNKIFGLISLTKSKNRNQNPQNEIDKAAKKEEKRRIKLNKQKDPSSKEKKATQTLAIVLGMIFFTSRPHFSRQPAFLKVTPKRLVIGRLLD